MKKNNFKQKIQYWFDNCMSQGPLFLIRTLAIAIFVMVIVISLLITWLHQSVHENIYLTMWDVFANTLNAWVPRVGDAIVRDKANYELYRQYGYLVISIFATLTGIIFSGALIAIINNSFIDKINELRKGTSIVVEKDHIVIFGFSSGEHYLISQIIVALGAKKTAVLVADNVKKEEMEKEIRRSVTIPSNIKLICRTIDTTDPKSIERLSIVQAKDVIINTHDDDKNFKTLLAVQCCCKKYGKDDLSITVATYNDDYAIPKEDIGCSNLCVLQTNELVARVIAHTCVNPGLSTAFNEILSFNDTSIFVQKWPEAYSQSFATICNSVKYSSPVGIYRKPSVIINPSRDYLIGQNDEIVCIGDVNLQETELKISPVSNEKSKINKMFKKKKEVYAIVGYNNAFPIIIEEISINAKAILVVGITKEQDRIIIRTVAIEKNHILTFTDEDCFSMVALEKLLSRTSHIVILGDYKNAEKSDSKTLLLVYKMRSIRRKMNYNFSITAELLKEKNKDLVSINDNTDFVVATSILDVVLAQIVMNPDLSIVISELLSQEGNETDILDIEEIGLVEGEYDVKTLREICLSYSCVFVGYVKNKNADRKIVINPSFFQKIKLTHSDGILLFRKWEE